MKQGFDIAGIGIICAVAVGFAWLAGGALPSWQGSNPLVLIVLWSIGLQWLGFGLAWRQRLERYYDVFGSLGHISAVVFALVLAPSLDGRRWLLASLALVWALRLGVFLYRRIVFTGSDSRFDDIRDNWSRFLLAWTLQSLWIVLTLAGVLLGTLSAHSVPVSGLAVIGGVCWALGFCFEATADAQKAAFRRDPANRGRFIQSGLWAWSRHPNYFGEIMMWFGIWLIALPVLQGWQHLAAISPLFVYLLLTRISGISLLEAAAERRWGQEPEFQRYRAATPVLWPRRPSR
ncbi:DUF1295 domain-containing protein [Spongiibacter taiwanensis]|uniref:DUF1295 domain-containing protein n=1 Tax=Spongiibacter taiwanensis TaxID=1748242 RepID=UPI0020355318|nr:DUF1295 domain-containing protein [Spongiibacter taiwanensis]USA44153.1 DUF1295 domain-containing protein [Spongiibacter taiwanensis]